MELVYLVCIPGCRGFKSWPSLLVSSSHFNIFTSPLRSFRLSVILLVSLFSCSENNEHQWVRVPAPDDGGFSFSLPIPGGSQIGELPLDGDTVKTHIMLLRDTGITYMASWLDLPPALDTLDDEAVFASISRVLGERTNGEKVDGSPIRVTKAQHVLWLQTEEGFRHGFVMNRMAGRLTILSVGCPMSGFGERQRIKVERFLGSFEGT